MEHELTSHGDFSIPDHNRVHSSYLQVGVSSARYFYNLSLERETDYYGEKLAIRREIVTVQQLLDAIEHRMSYDGRRCFDILFTEKERDTFSIPPLPEVS